MKQRARYPVPAYSVLEARKFVPQRLTVLLSYEFEASVPLCADGREIKNGNCQDGTQSI